MLFLLPILALASLALARPERAAPRYERVDREVKRGEEEWLDEERVKDDEEGEAESDLVELWCGVVGLRWMLVGDGGVERDKNTPSL